MKNKLAILFVVLALSCPALAGNDRGGKLPPQGTSIKGCPPSECDCVDGNLVANCGFETGDFTDWTLSGDQSFTGVALGGHSGCYGAYFGPPNLGFAAQDLPTAAGEYYDLSFWLSNLGIGTPNALRVLWNGAIVYSCYNCPSFPDTHFAFTELLATDESTELKFGFFNVPDYFFFDDVVVTVSSESTTK